MSNETKWDIIIKSKVGLFEINIKEIFYYRDLIWLFVKRDFVIFYKQTILGPLWYIIQPLINTLVFTIIFGKLANISTDGISPFLFYLAGNVVWGYFAVCLTTTSTTFLTNSNIFGKVYFPRLTVPIANVLFSLLQFFIQFTIFLIFLIYYKTIGFDLKLNLSVLMLPLILIQIALLSLGIGILISSLTVKYRDLTFVMNFGIQLWMFATPIVYPMSIIPEKYRLLISLNPMTAVVETFRKIFLGESSIEIIHILISVLMTIIIIFLGLINFNRVEKNFMDTI